MISTAEQDYIKSIFALQQMKGSVSTSDLAQRLNITPASVSGMLRKLDDAALISHEPYRGVKLTEQGKRYAAAILRRHRLIELFLVKILDMPWEEVHAEAEILEHAVSDAILDRIDKLLGHPERDPHGSPIPLPNGKITVTQAVRLDEMAPGCTGVIVEIPDDDPELVRYLSKHGVVPGTRFVIRDVLAIDGTRTLGIGNREIYVSSRVAASIQVSLDKGVSKRKRKK